MEAPIPATLTTQSDREQQLDELTERGLALYESTLKTFLEREHLGQVVAIEPDSREYAIGSDSSTAVRAIRARNISGLVFVRRIGPPTEEDDRFASRLAASEAKRK